MGDSSSEEMLAIVHPDHLVHYKEGSMPAQLLVFLGKREGDRTSIEPALEQSWTFPQAKEVVASAAHKILVSDMMAGGLPYKERLTLFLNCLDGLVQSLTCAAIHWRPSQQVISPDHYLESRRDPQQHILQAMH